MFYSKENIVGLDALIYKLQKKLYDKLKVLWDYDLEAYPRCYINYNEKEKDIEYYQGKKEYYSVLHGEKTKFFFTQEEAINPADTEGYESKVELYFIIDFKNLNKTLNRDDYQCISEIESIIKSSPFIVERIETDFRSIFSGFRIMSEKDNFQPYLSLKFTLKSDRFLLNQKLCNNG